MANYLHITEFPKNVIAGFEHKFRLTAKNTGGATDTGYTGVVVFSSDDTGAVVPTNLPNPYTFVGGDLGTKVIEFRLTTAGNKVIIADDGAITKATARVSVEFRPPGWGFDDFGLLPYGDAAGSIGISLKAASVVSTRQVEVEVSNLAQDDSPFLAGDALNPSTWLVQRLDSLVFLNVVSVTQTGTYKYTLLCLEEFGPVGVTHRVSSTTLKDQSGNAIVSPRQADFLGITDAAKDTVEDRLATRRMAAVDIANPQVPKEPFFAGTLQLGADGDYLLESGTQLIRKLWLRRLVTQKGDFFHLPDYGVGIRVKEPIPVANLGRLKTQIEEQLAREPEVESVTATVSMDSRGILTVQARGALRKTGEAVQVGFKSDDRGLVL